MYRESEFGAGGGGGLIIRNSEVILNTDDSMRFESLPKSKPEFMNVIIEEDELATRLSHKSDDFVKEETKF
jgi:hypothetical protein